MDLAGRLTCRQWLVFPMCGAGPVFGRTQFAEPWRQAGVMTAHTPAGNIAMNNIIYIVGLVVVVIAVLSFFGLR